MTIPFGLKKTTIWSMFETAHSAALRGLAHLLEKEPASHTASGQSNATAGRVAGSEGVVGGGHSGGLGLLDKADEAFEATRLGLEVPAAERSQLKLPDRWWVFLPAANRWLLDSECASHCSLRPEVLDCVLCFHQL
ncbi:MAG: hypothetical protein Q7U67_03110 [Hydrogenophaga sp.]|nr:hypothetical protein [Hydrogenophaga sp.]